MNFYRLYADVSLGEDCQIGDFASIGLPPRGFQEGDLKTILGNRVVVQSHATICAGNVLGDDCTIGHGLFMRHNSQIGNRVSIGSQSVLEWNVIIEDDVTIGAYAGISEFTVIEAGTWLGSQVALPSVLHPLCPKAKECGRGPRLQRGVTVGGAAIIYPDLRIGTGAFIQPCAVVVADVKPFSVMAGNPAKPIGDIFNLAPELLERVGRVTDLSPEAIAHTIEQFEAQPSLFPAKPGAAS